MADKTTDNFPRRDPGKLRTVASFMLGGAATLTVGAVGYGIATNPDLQSPSGLASILAERSDAETTAAPATVTETVTVTTTAAASESESGSESAESTPSQEAEPSASVEPQDNTGFAPGDPRHEGHTDLGTLASEGTQNTQYGYAPGSVHHISWGETLSGISAQYGVSVDKLVAVNSIADPDLIYAGSVLQLP